MAWTANTIVYQLITQCAGVAKVTSAGVAVSERCTIAVIAWVRLTWIVDKLTAKRFRNLDFSLNLKNMKVRNYFVPV